MALIFSDNLIYVYHTKAGAAVIDFVSASPDGSFGNINTTAGEWARFGMPILGELIYDKAFAFDDPPVTDSASIALPPDANPPFPPVWPYTWNTGLLYGREHLGQNLRMTREDDFRFRVTITKGGLVFDITGATFTLSAKWAVTDVATVFTRTLGSGLTVVVAADGTLDVHIASANTTSLPLYTVPLYYDIEMVDATGDISTPIQGILTVNPDIT